jgi:NarL family two-component system response regulator LiaR
VLKVVFADDRSWMRAPVAAFLAADAELEVIGEATLGTDLIEVTQAVRPDVVLIATGASTRDGLLQLSELQTSHPHTTVIVISSSADRGYIEAALQLGAFGYVRMSMEPHNLAEAIHKVIEARAYRAL